MSRRSLPPLEINSVYRANNFENIEFASRDFWKDISGEDTAIFRIRLARATVLEVAISDDDLKRHMHHLISAFPDSAREFLNAQQRHPASVSNPED